MADREFIGDSWFIHFAELQLNFIIRIRKGMYKKNLLAGRSYAHLQKRANKKGQASTLIELEGAVFRLWVIHKHPPHIHEPFIYISKITKISEFTNHYTCQSDKGYANSFKTV